jgi:hypothetical protein
MLIVDTIGRIQRENLVKGKSRSRPARSSGIGKRTLIVVINNVTTTVKVAHVRLCHSRMMFVRAYPRET